VEYKLKLTKEQIEQQTKEIETAMAAQLKEREEEEQRKYNLVFDVMFLGLMKKHGIPDSEQQNFITWAVDTIINRKEFNSADITELSKFITIIDTYINEFVFDKELKDLLND
jgi:tRNA C32,U32 (ribose-2'-O)-methylase TrmJ